VNGSALLKLGARQSQLQAKVFGAASHLVGRTTFRKRHVCQRSGREAARPNQVRDCDSLRLPKPDKNGTLQPQTVTTTRLYAMLRALKKVAAHLPRLFPRGAARNTPSDMTKL